MIIFKKTSQTFANSNLFATFVTMNTTEQTLQQIERSIRKTAEKYPTTCEAEVLTDIHMRVNQETGELVSYDDDDNELNRCVIEEWIDNKDDDFYEQIVSVLRNSLENMHETVDNLSILKPYAFVLEDEEKESVAELRVVDDDTVIIDSELMAGLDEDLNTFFENLMKE
jgi:hypothetical protein